MRFSPFSSDTVQRIINDNRIVVFFGRINDLADPGIGINRVVVHLRPVDPRNLVSGDATSNRRHLVRETFKDKADRDEELHTNDTVQEKLSLVARFGVTIYFGKPDKKEFQKIVTTLADRYGVEMEEEKLLLEANKWELSHGGLSGRTAQQFIDYLLGQQ